MKRLASLPLLALLALALAACDLLPAEPPTPTPRSRADQIATATAVAAQLAATAEARALPTFTPTPRATATPLPSLSGKGNSGKPLKATPIEWRAQPLADGRRYRDPSGYFLLTIPHDWEEFSTGSRNAVTGFVGPSEPDDRVITMSIIVWDIPQKYWVLPLSDITNASMAEVREYLGKDYTFVRLERIKANGLEMDRLICQDALERYTIVQAYMIVEHILHVLTFQTPDEQVEANLPLFDAVLASYTPAGKPTR